MTMLSTGMTEGGLEGSMNRMERLEMKAHSKIDMLRSRVSGNLSAKTAYLREDMASLLRRTDVVGYGAAHPRVAVVVVVPPLTSASSESGEHDEQTLLDSALEAVESVFRTTDRNRIFIVTVVMDGWGKIGSFETRLQGIDAGRTKHRHGGKVHTHDHHHDWKMEDQGEQDKDHEVHSHSEKIHAIYNHETVGVSASRKEAVHFINVLARKHEEAGLKSSEEDLVLLFLRCDAALREYSGDRVWLDDVTDALVLSPFEEYSEAHRENTNEQTMQPANAISFVMDFSSTDTDGNVEIHNSHIGETLNFDQTLRPHRSSATAQQMALSNGESYPTPLTLGAATALRLETYNTLPAADEKLTTHYSADLELSFNLWMCADGIDVLGSSLAHAVVDPVVLSTIEKSDLSGPLAARLVSAWMGGHDDDMYASSFLRSVAESSAVESQNKIAARGDSLPKDHDLSESRALADKTQQLKNMLVRISAEAKQSTTFPPGLDKKCRPFSWYVEHVNPELKIEVENGISSAENAKLNKGAKLIPSKPLSDENMSIVARASPVKLAYVDISGGHTEHPHRGATDENGNFGYVHDETALAKSPPPFEFKDESEKAALCKKGGEVLPLLLRRLCPWYLILSLISYCFHFVRPQLQNADGEGVCRPHKSRGSGETS